MNPMRKGFSFTESMNWYSYTSNNPVKYVDPTGLFTLGLGLSGQGGVLGGGQAGFGMMLSLSKDGGIQFGGYISAGGGAHGPASGSLNLDFSFSGYENISDTSGRSTEIGGSTSLGIGLGISFTVNFPDTGKNGLETLVQKVKASGKPIYTGSVQLTAKGAASEAHSYVNYTGTVTLLQIGGAEKEGVLQYRLPKTDSQQSVQDHIKEITPLGP
jgi:hypothetical protein